MRVERGSRKKEETRERERLNFYFSAVKIAQRPTQRERE